MTDDSGTSPANPPPQAAARLRTLSVIFALATAALLAFAAFAKFYKPNPKQEVFDYAVGAIQVLIVIGVVVQSQKWWTWSALAIMWAGLAGWSFFKSYHGASCGCFAALFDPPPYTSGLLDSALALTSLGVAFLRVAPRALFGATLAGLLVAGPVGWVVADQTTPPNIAEQQEADPDYKPARQRLLETDLMADILAQEEGEAAWLIFCHDPECHICEHLMPFMDELKDRLESTQDPVMQVRKFSIPELNETVGIEPWAWPSTPTIFVVQDGQTIAQWYGETAEDWSIIELEQIYDAVANYDIESLPWPNQLADTPKEDQSKE